MFSYVNCCNHPKASTFFFMWSAVEDYILSSFISCVLEHQVDHLSLHFDGMRVKMTDPNFDMEAFCETCVERAAQETGFSVKLVLKQHCDFFSAIKAIVTSNDLVLDVDDVLLRPGNCIPNAIQYIQGQQSKWSAALMDKASPQNANALRRKASLILLISIILGILFFVVTYVFDLVRSTSHCNSVLGSII
jgi:hypothetical protein